MNELANFVYEHTLRGDCECGNCFDAPAETKQPEGHTVNMTFFKMAKRGEPDAEKFRELVKDIDVSNGPSYIHIGADIGDQGLALLTMGLGHLLGVWQVQGPDTIPALIDSPDELKKQMAGAGMIYVTKAP